MKFPPRLLMSGMAVGLDLVTNLEFQIDRPYRACLICGAVFQSELDRLDVPANSEIAKIAASMRSEWAGKHGKTHSQHQHEMLQLSGLVATPEAAQKLAPFGIIPVVDLVMDDEVRDALSSAPGIPINDSEG